MMSFGPIQILGIGFGSTARMEGQVAEALINASDAGIIRIIDALAVIREGDEVDVLRVSDLDDEQREELGAQVGALIGLGANGIDGFIAGAELGAEIADSGGLGVIEALGEELIEGLPDDSAAVILIIEHRWAVPLRDAVMDAGGELIANRWVGVQELVSLGAALRAEAELEG
jgi:hypothetical protein